MIVLDASAILELLLGTEAGHRVAARVEDPALGLHAPHLLDVEVAQVLRRYVRARELSSAAGAEALETLQELCVLRHPHPPLMGRVWELRADLTAYDGVYVALAEALGAPLLTCDGKLARAPGVRADVELLE